MAYREAEVVLLPAYGDDGKTPLVSTRSLDHQSLTDSDILKIWGDGFNRRPMNYWVWTQASRVIALDIDSPGAMDMWKAILGVVALDDAAQALSLTKGLPHFYWRLPASYDGPYGDINEEGQFDIRLLGGIIVPPSSWEGRAAQWVNAGWRDMGTAPVALLDWVSERLTNRRYDPTTPGLSPKLLKEVSSSSLSQLLASPPAEGGRNSWLATVAGHYVNLCRGQRDLYDVQVSLANALCRPPLSEEEAAKVADSVWGYMPKSLAVVKEGAPAFDQSEQSGYLRGDGMSIFTLIEHKDDEGEKSFLFKRWARFDIEVEAISEDRSTYRVEITDLSGRRVRTSLSRPELAHAKAGDAWLAQHSLIVLSKQGMSAELKDARSIRWYDRLWLYIENKAMSNPNLRILKLADHAGWNGQDLVAPDGRVAYGEKSADYTIRSRDGSLLSRLTWGTRGLTPDLVRDLLREVMTFHWPEVTSVFGAWWMACWFKPIMEEYGGQFPIFGFMAPSGVGKTTGFTGLMMQLAGLSKPIQATVPVVRDSMSVTSVTPVWLDDMRSDQYDGILNLLRHSTSGGDMSLKNIKTGGVDSDTIRLVAPVFLSGESLPGLTEKAIRDRTILLETLRSPSSRRSRFDPEQPQYNDVLRVIDEHRDPTRPGIGLSSVAFDVAASVAPLASGVAGLMRLHQVDLGRRGRYLTVLRVGSKLLAEFLGTEEYDEHVSEYISNEVAQYHPNSNSLVTEFLPFAMERIGASMLNIANEVVPVHILPDGRIWFHVEGLVNYLQAQRYQDRRGLMAVDSIRQQAKTTAARKQLNRRTLDRKQINRSGWVLSEEQSLDVYRACSTDFGSGMLSSEDPAGLFPEPSGVDG
jgi:hypothetical protein